MTRPPQMALRQDRTKCGNSGKAEFGSIATLRKYMPRSHRRAGAQPRFAPDREISMPRLHINGAQRNIDADPQMPLLWAIRDLVGLTGTKFGCGVGACGACTVLMDGNAIRSCITTLADAEGHEIVTIEGLSPDGSHPVQRAWEANNVPQCGYCQSGQIMQAAALLRQTPKPTDQQITDAMYGNICRCGTYQRIRQAIKAAEM
jgi:isoquinoline 1-oxidoreductase alpha subunit